MHGAAVQSLRACHGASAQPEPLICCASWSWSGPGEELRRGHAIGSVEVPLPPLKPCGWSMPADSSPVAVKCQA